MKPKKRIIEEIKFIWREHKKADKTFEELLDYKYGEKNVLLALADIAFSKKNRK